MPIPGMEDHIVDREVYDRTVQRFKQRNILLPTFAELAKPSLIPLAIRQALAGVKPDAADPLNLFRVHWYNDADRTSQAALPGHAVLPKELTGVEARLAGGDVAHRIVTGF